MRIKPRSHTRWWTVMLGVLTIASVTWRVFEAWDTLEFINEKSGFLWTVVKFLFASQVGANVLVVTFVALFVGSLLFQMERGSASTGIRATGRSALDPLTASERPSVPSTSEATIPLVQQSDGRIILDVTPEYLTGICREHTVIQANKLIETYIGKWLRVSGTVKEVRSYPDSSVVVHLMSGGSLVSADFIEQRWTDHVATFPRGTEITVLGKLSRAEDGITGLTECELI